MSPKHGGILQSSGFLDLKSLIALSETAKGNHYDERSLILLIENEVTRNHRATTVRDAINLLQSLWNWNSYLKGWMEREGNGGSILQAEHILQAVKYEVMLFKMLRAIPESLRLQFVTDRSTYYERSALHCAAMSGNIESFKAILSIYLQSDQFKAMSVRDLIGLEKEGLIGLCDTAYNSEMIQYLLNLLPESQRLPTVKVSDDRGRTILHLVARCFESTKAILSLYPEELRLRAIFAQDNEGSTVLHWAIFGEIESIRYLLSLLSASQRLELVNMRDHDGFTALLRYVRFPRKNTVGVIRTVLDMLPESQVLQALKVENNRRTILHDVANHGNVESIKYILNRVPKSECTDRRSILRLLRDTGESIKKRPHEARKAEKTDSERSVAKRARLDSN